MAASKGFSVGGAVKFGWGHTKTNFGFFAGLLILVAVILCAPLLFQVLVARYNLLPIVLVPVLMIVFFVLQTVLCMGLIRIAL